MLHPIFGEPCVSVMVLVNINGMSEVINPSGYESQAPFGMIHRTRSIMLESLVLNRDGWENIRFAEDRKYRCIENIVASGVIADEINLAEIAEKIDGCELNTKRFPGAVYRIDDPRMASLIFSSGKVVLTGIRNESALQDGLEIILKSQRSRSQNPGRPQGCSDQHCLLL